jgi:hypothetical protein
MVYDEVSNSGNIFQCGFRGMPEDTIGFTMNRNCICTKGLQQPQGGRSAGATIRIDQYPWGHGTNGVGVSVSGSQCRDIGNMP